MIHHFILVLLYFHFTIMHFMLVYHIKFQNDALKSYHITSSGSSDQWVTQHE